MHVVCLFVCSSGFVCTCAHPGESWVVTSRTDAADGLHTLLPSCNMHMHMLPTFRTVDVCAAVYDDDGGGGGEHMCVTIPRRKCWLCDVTLLYNGDDGWRLFRLVMIEANGYISSYGKRNVNLVGMPLVKRCEYKLQLELIQLYHRIGICYSFRCKGFIEIHSTRQIEYRSWWIPTGNSECWRKQISLQARPSIFLKCS